MSDQKILTKNNIFEFKDDEALDIHALKITFVGQWQVSVLGSAWIPWGTHLSTSPRLNRRNDISRGPTVLEKSRFNFTWDQEINFAAQAWGC